MPSKTVQAVVATGRRKTALARATVTKGTGRIRVNRIPLDIYRPELARLRIAEPLHIAGAAVRKVDIEVAVSGGGVMGQASAARTAIARGLVRFLDDKELDDTFRLFDRSIMVNDVRQKEPKHQLGRGARKKRQKSYR
ncbi:MAG: 30S ribosomal protein S9 [Euryarchaeota archaeon]|nr:30S ribosomal protein S9 [Euryarchaeota archaeon]